MLDSQDLQVPRDFLDLWELLDLMEHLGLLGLRVPYAKVAVPVMLIDFDGCFSFCRNGYRLLVDSDGVCSSVT